MEMKKRSGPCTEDLFWDCVAEIDWASKPKTDQAKRAILLSWTPEFGAEFSKLLEQKERKVCKTFLAYEREELSERQRDQYYLGDDGFGDFCSHVVGMGREVFEAEVENPQKLFERACERNFKEKFSYCIPDAPSPDTTFETWVKMHRYPITQEDYDAEKRYDLNCLGDEDETFEEHMELIRRTHRDWQLGGWAYVDPGHYVPRAKSLHARAAAFVAAFEEGEELTRREGEAVVFATMLMHYFAAVVDGKTEEALLGSEEAMRAWWSLYYIDRNVGALRRQHSDLLPMAGGEYGGENLINDHRVFMGGLDEFKCRHHLNLLIEASTAAEEKSA